MSLFHVAGRPQSLLDSRQTSSTRPPSSSQMFVVRSRGRKYPTPACRVCVLETILVLPLPAVWPHPLAPQPQDISFDDWWEKVEASIAGDLRKGLNSLVILGSWSIWRHRNSCVFNGSSPSVAAAQ